MIFVVAGRTGLEPYVSVLDDSEGSNDPVLILNGKCRFDEVIYYSRNLVPRRK